MQACRLMASGCACKYTGKRENPPAGCVTWWVTVYKIDGLWVSNKQESGFKLDQPPSSCSCIEIVTLAIQGEFWEDWHFWGTGVSNQSMIPVPPVPISLWFECFSEQHCLRCIYRSKITLKMINDQDLGKFRFSHVYKVYCGLLLWIPVKQECRCWLNRCFINY